jgi:hypothetical protein
MGDGDLLDAGARRAFGQEFLLRFRVAREHFHEWFPCFQFALDIL